MDFLFIGLCMMGLVVFGFNLISFFISFFGRFYSYMAKDVILCGVGFVLLSVGLMGIQ